MTKFLPHLEVEEFLKQVDFKSTSVSIFAWSSFLRKQESRLKIWEEHLDTRFREYDRFERFVF